jgi:hypothetical protein
MSDFMKMKLYLSRTKPFSFLKNLQTVLVHRIGTESIPSYLLEFKKRIKACIFRYHSFLEKKLCSFQTNCLLLWSDLTFPQFTARSPAITEYFEAILHDSCIFYAFSVDSSILRRYIQQFLSLQFDPEKV